MTASISSSTRTSKANATMSGPMLRSSSAVASISSRVPMCFASMSGFGSARSVSAIRQPSAASRAQIARPSPRLRPAPVTSATLPASAFIGISPRSVQASATSSPERTFGSHSAAAAEASSSGTIATDSARCQPIAATTTGTTLG